MSKLNTDHFQQLAIGLAKLAPAMQNMSRCMETLHSSVYGAYQRAGMPYGDNLEGYLRWSKEIADRSPEAHTRRIQGQPLRLP